jgi:hypothetical protein
VTIICGGHGQKDHVNNPHSLQELEDNLQRDIANTSRQGLHDVSCNIFVRHKACLEAASYHFETLL